MILGLDISTSITGYTIMNDSGIVIECDHIDLKKEVGAFSKGVKIQNKLDELYTKYKFDAVWIEESLQMFTMGKSSSKVLAALTKFNGIVSWIAYQFCTNVNYIPAVSARKQIGLKMIKGTKGKEIVMKHMIDNEKWFTVEYKKTGKVKDYCFDRADSFVIAKAGFLKIPVKSKP